MPKLWRVLVVFSLGSLVTVFVAAALDLPWWGCAIMGSFVGWFSFDVAQWWENKDTGRLP